MINNLKIEYLVTLIEKVELLNFKVMPGKSPCPQVKDKDQYEALRGKGYSKEKSARIANSKGAEKRGGKSDKYEDQTKQELYDQAKKVGIDGRSKMSKAELIKALRNN